MSDAELAYLVQRWTKIRRKRGYSESLIDLLAFARDHFDVEDFDELNSIQMELLLCRAEADDP